MLGPKFSKKDRTTINLRRAYSLNQVELCRNFIFRRHFPIHKIFERSAELGVFRLTADVITQIFGVRKHKRLRGKLHTMLEKVDHGHHVLRIYGKSLVARMYEKFGTFLRIEVCVNRLKDLGLNKGLENLPALRTKLIDITDRLAGVEADLLNVHVDFPVFERLAKPVATGRTRIPGIKIHDTRLLRLMEVLLHGGSQLTGWRTADMHRAVREAFAMTPEAYSLTQLRYDVRKLRAHGLLERDGRRYCYRLTDKGVRVAAMRSSPITGRATHASWSGSSNAPSRSPARTSWSRTTCLRRYSAAMRKRCCRRCARRTPCAPEPAVTRGPCSNAASATSAAPAACSGSRYHTLNAHLRFQPGVDEEGEIEEGEPPESMAT